MLNPLDYYFCGIGGAGMSPLALLLAKRGKRVAGSDRSYDQGRNQTLFNQLKSEGIELYPQDGSEVNAAIKYFVITRAVEANIPDIVCARELGLEIIKRPTLQADLFSKSRNIAVGGTSGKSTTTAMIGFILAKAGLQPTVVNGAVMLDCKSSIVNGSENLAVFEADESDGLNDVIANCNPAIAVLTNISHDHFEIDELSAIFTQFLASAKEAVVINADCQYSSRLIFAANHVVTYGVDAKAQFTPKNCAIDLKVPGKHNLSNALAAIGACSILGVSPSESCSILKEFSGVKRRLELVGIASGIAVYDDFASNPDKIAASLQTVFNSYQRVLVIFQPHGFQPTKMMRQGYIDVFSRMLRQEDVLIMPEIYYAGGNSNIIDGKAVPLPKGISSADLINEIKENCVNAYFVANRSTILTNIEKFAADVDCIIVMGSRDETLPIFANEILQSL